MMTEGRDHTFRPARRSPALGICALVALALGGAGVATASCIDTDGSLVAAAYVRSNPPVGIADAAQCPVYCERWVTACKEIARSYNACKRAATDVSSRAAEAFCADDLRSSCTDATRDGARYVAAAAKADTAAARAFCAEQHADCLAVCADAAR